MLNSLLDLIPQLKYSKEKKSFLNDRYEDSWRSSSSYDFVKKIESYALGLKSLGVVKGDNIGLIADSCSQWLAIEMAILMIGGVSVPMFANASKANMAFQLADAKIEYLFIIGQEQWDLVTVRTGFKHIITEGIKNTESLMMSLEDLILAGQNENAEGVFSDMLKSVKPSDVATIIYTSGTYGKPKGVCLTHANLVHQIKGYEHTFNLNSEDQILCCLPLAHIFQKMTAYYFLQQRCSIFFIDNIQNLGILLKELKPTAMIVVPRILEKVHQKIKDNIQIAKGFKKILGRLALHRAESKDINTALGMRDHLYKKMVYQKFLQATGGRFKVMVSGGAPLADHISRFFINIGVPLCQGYGLTEASPVVSTNSLTHNKIGTVGRPLYGVQLKFLSDGEICVKGNSVMQGYWNSRQQTEEVITTDGWLKTGDLGNLDDDGYLKIVGRKKELFKTSTGKYISPVVIEQALTEHSLIEFSLVIAEQRSFVTALLFPSELKIAALKKNHLSVPDYFNTEEFKKAMDLHIQQVNQKLNEWERIRRYKVVPQVLSVEKGYLTPKMSLRRSVLMDAFTETIDELYYG